MSPLLDELDNEQRAFVIGTSYHVQFYETQEGIRYARQRDGTYSAGGSSFASFFDLLEQTLGPLTSGQLYALVAIYHPLVTGRISPDREPEKMSRSEARTFIAEEFIDVTPFDLSLDAGTLRFAARDQRRSLSYPPPRKISEPAPPPQPPALQSFTALLEVTYVADEGISQDDIRQRLQHDTDLLSGQDNGGGIMLRRVDIASISGSEEKLDAA